MKAIELFIYDAWDVAAVAAVMLNEIFERLCFWVRFHAAVFCVQLVSFHSFISRETIHYSDTHSVRNKQWPISNQVAH